LQTNPEFENPGNPGNRIFGEQKPRFFGKIRNVVSAILEGAGRTLLVLIAGKRILLHCPSQTDALSELWPRIYAGENTFQKCKII
jgi:hypothetical protein